MSILSGVSSFFGLDIGTNEIRVVQLQGGSSPKQLLKYGHMPIDPKLSMSDAKADQQRVMQAVKQFIEQLGISTRNVAFGLPSNKVFTTIVDIERLSTEEIGKTIRYQADSLIPTSVKDSKLDWAVLGNSYKDEGKVEVLLSSVINEYIELKLDLLESIGLNVIAFEPDSLALARSLYSPQNELPCIVIDMGSKTTDIVILFQNSPRLVRSLPMGMESIIRSAMQNLNIDEKQARQFVYKFGLNRSKLEGQVFDGISSTIDALMGDIDKSIKFFKARYVGQDIDRIIVSGGVATLPDFPLFIANRFAVKVEIGNAWKNVAISSNQQAELMALSAQFAVASGLAQRIEG